MTEEYFGESCLRSISLIPEFSKASRVFLVTGRDSFSLSGAQEAMDPYLANKAVVRFSDFSVNPEIRDVIRGVFQIRQGDCDIIIAVGGGSVIDMAKLIRVIAPSVHDPQDIAIGKTNVEQKGLPLIAIPTTAGSGSEGTRFAVVYVNQTKFSVDHEYVLPDYSIIDPSFTYSLPPRLTAVTGFDALCHAVESYWGVGATEESQDYASRSIRMILSALESAVNSPSPEARNTMSLAAHLAGKAINITKTTAPHALSYPLTAYFHVPHGHAVALVLGKFFVVNSRDGGVDWNGSRGKEYVQKVMCELRKMFGCVSPQECSERWYRLMAAVGLETTLGALGICHKSDIDFIIDNVNAERIANNPVLVTRTILSQLFP